MASSGEVDVHAILEQAISHVSTLFPKEFEAINNDPERKKHLRHRAEKTVTDYMKTLQNIRDRGMESEDALEHFDHERRAMIKSSLDMKTFEIHDEDEGKVSYKFKGTALFLAAPTMVADRSAGWLQIASIIMEAVVLVLSMIGITVPEGRLQDQEVINTVMDMAGRCSRVTSDLASLIRAYNASAAMSDIARIILNLVIGMFHSNVLFDIVRAFLSNLDWWDWILLAVSLAASIVAMVSTGGVAFIARLVGTITSGAVFVRKLLRIQHVNDDELRGLLNG